MKFVPTQKHVNRAVLKFLALGQTQLFGAVLYSLAKYVVSAGVMERETKLEQIYCSWNL